MWINVGWFDYGWTGAMFVVSARDLAASQYVDEYGLPPYPVEAASGTTAESKLKYGELVEQWFSMVINHFWPEYIGGRLLMLGNSPHMNRVFFDYYHPKFSPTSNHDRHKWLFLQRCWECNCRVDAESMYSVKTVPAPDKSKWRSYEKVVCVNCSEKIAAVQKLERDHK